MEVKDKIIGAYNKLLEKDGYLLEVDANERSLTHRFAMYLQDEFVDYNVDCEYNRNGMDVKRLDSFKKNIESDDTNAVTVYPDIIIHQRGTQDNFIVIEAKKTSNTDETDIEKLRSYKTDLGYKQSFFVRFPVGVDFQNLNSESTSQFIQEIQ